MPNSRPRIVFNHDEICNACSNRNEKKQIDWVSRQNEFNQLIDKIKKKSHESNSYYDCIVPWSGGKDSSSIAMKLKFEFGLNPLLVTFSPLIINEIGEYNRNELSKMGFDTIFIKPNQKVAKQLAKRFFKERGNPKVAWDAGVNAGPIQIALNYNIKTVFYAEHGESEYGGLVLNEESKKKRDIREVIEHQVGDYPENWISDEIKKNDLAPYVYPNIKLINKNDITAYYFGYFFKWSMLENYNYIRSNLKNFRTHPKSRTSGTFTNFDSLDDKIDPLYYYMQYIKFGFGRATRDSCRMIQNDQMLRDEAIELARKYDHEFPSDDFEEVLSYLDLSEEEFENIVNKHRNDEIWQIVKNNKWELKNKI
tara:strand:- start:1101 stop:2198 length:1098 start_codon:yes stop_codon:yes gene_type:complete